jgi:protein-S-isoprenylcysteine O-methyltransferase Ste14
MKQSEKDQPRVLTIPPLLYVSMLLVGLGVDHFAPIEIITNPLNFWLGLTFLSISIPLVISGLYVMRRAETGIDVRKPTTTIVTAGPFRFSRNPLYLSLTLLYIAISLFINSLAVLLGLIPALMLMQWGVIKPEERYLEEKFLQQYLEYKQSVRRWL